MRRLVALIVLGLSFGAIAYAQQATLNTPVTRTSEDNYRVESYFLTRDSGGRWEAVVSVRDSGSTEIRRVTYNGPDAAHATATATAFNTAVSFTVVGGETGSNTRKADFRVLTFLNAQGYLPAGVTVAPRMATRLEGSAQMVGLVDDRCPKPDPTVHGDDWFPADVTIEDTKTAEQRVWKTWEPERAEWSDFIWTEGNFSCDCNRYLFFEYAAGVDPDVAMQREVSCSHGDVVRYRIVSLVDARDGKLLYAEQAT